MWAKRAFIVVLSVMVTVTGLFTQAKADNPKAREIMEKVDVRDDGDNIISDVEMILIDKKGKKREREMKMFSKDYGEDVYRLIFFLKPPDVKDTAFLTYDYDGEKDDDQWLHLPALRKTKRIASDNKTSSFMGSDFSYADMTKREPENYNFKLLNELDVRGHKCWLIESIPKTKKIVDDYGYKKFLVFVRQDNYVVVRSVGWVNKGNDLKYMDVKRLKKINNIWTRLEVTMTTKRGKATRHKTILRYNNVKYNQDLSDDTFTVRTMEKGL